MIYELKTWPEYFEEVFMGHKTFEVRKADRQFAKGDTLILKEWDVNTGQYTGREMARTITYILEGGQIAGIDVGFVAMSIQ
jgi:ASC-1-like (ASCH) protein